MSLGEFRCGGILGTARSDARLYNRFLEQCPVDTNKKPLAMTIEVEGKAIPTTVTELLAPKSAALLIIDVQNDFCAPGGVTDSHSKLPKDYEQMVASIDSLRREARDASVLVIYIQNTFLPNLRSHSPAWLRWVAKAHGISDYRKLPELTVEGTWGHEFIEEIKPLPGDIVVKKHRASAFIGTDLDMILRSNGIKTVALVGVVTPGCVESTARDASFFDYFVVIVEDGVGCPRRDLHEASMTLLRWRFDVLSSPEVISVWKNAR